MKIQVFHPSFIRIDDRGNFVEIVEGNKWNSISYGHMKKNAVMGNHYHKKTNVFFFLIKGDAIVDIINAKTHKTATAIIKINEGIIFAPFISHAIRFTSDSTFLMGKSNKFDPSDTYQLNVPNIYKSSKKS